MHRRHLLPIFASLLGTLAANPAPAQTPPPLTIFAAASLTDAMRALSEAWQTQGNPPPRFSFAASSALARQIEQGAPADLFISADEQWMDYLQTRNLIARDTRTSPLGNSLVLIAPADRARPIALTRTTDLAALLGAGGRIATGDPAHVPVGRYAQSALEWMGQWPALAPRLARAENVRSALLLVERGEAPYGIVYATDAAASQAVRVVGTFPPESHPTISYPFAITSRAAEDPRARTFLAFLVGTAAADTWRRFGFTRQQRDEAAGDPIRGTLAGGTFVTAATGHADLTKAATAAPPAFDRAHQSTQRPGRRRGDRTTGDSAPDAAQDAILTPPPR